jgi:hypothetical protein
MDSVFFWFAMTMMGLAVVTGWFPLWKSTRLSPDSIQRRSYWTCTALCVLGLFLSQVPDWKAAAVLSLGIAFGMTAVALRWTRHVIVRGRIYAVHSDQRGPDRPPVLSE